MNNNRKNILLLIIVTYNALGLLSLFSLYPSDPFYGSIFEYTFLITLPITLFGFAWRYVSISIFPVFIIQLIVFLSQILIFLYLASKKKK